MPKAATRTPLDLAHDLLRYSQMDDQTIAYDELHKEWPPEIAAIIEKVLWTQVEISQGMVSEAAAAMYAANLVAEWKAVKVKDFILAKGNCSTKNLRLFQKP